MEHKNTVKSSKNTEIEDEKNNLVELETVQSIGENYSGCSFRTEKDKICVICKEDDNLAIGERERIKEESDFVFWFRDTQLTAKLEGNTWKLVLVGNGEALDSKEIEGFSERKDKFIKIESRLYLNIYSSFKLYKIEIRDAVIEMEYIGKIKGALCSLVESPKSLYIGTNRAFQRIGEEGIVDVFDTGEYVTDIKIVEDAVWVVDWSGRAVQLKLRNNEKIKKIKLKGNGCHFFSGNNLVRVGGEGLTVFDWQGRVQSTHRCEASHTAILERNTDFVVLSSEKRLIVWDNSALKARQFESNHVLKLYSR